ncbi:MAG: hypothetical protein LBK60_00230 [Verrucomicrobiales bacterium]|jgi:hypothetical protein|nr:hypothetical protein [Verrucomicrobiales bacterium]
MAHSSFGIVVAVRGGKLTVVGAPQPLSQARQSFIAALADGGNSEVVIVSSVHGVIKRRKTRHPAAAAGDGKKKGAKK